MKDDACTCGALGTHFGCPVARATSLKLELARCLPAAARSLSPMQLVRRGCNRLHDLRPGFRPTPPFLS